MVNMKVNLCNACVSLGHEDLYEVKIYLNASLTTMVAFPSWTKPIIPIKQTAGWVSEVDIFSVWNQTSIPQFSFPALSR
jgi:hypothetical protein